MSKPFPCKFEVELHIHTYFCQILVYICSQTKEKSLIMHYQTRVLAHSIKHCLETFSVLGLTGPRQSGKSTLLQHLLGD